MNGGPMSEPENLRHYAHVRDGMVVNVTVWDGITKVTRPDDIEVVPLPFTDDTDEETGETTRRYTGGIGWTYRDGEFIDERPVEIQPDRDAF